jgi:hypothetical protein
MYNLSVSLCPLRQYGASLAGSEIASSMPSTGTRHLVILAGRALAVAEEIVPRGRRFAAYQSCSR